MPTLPRRSRKPRSAAPVQIAPRKAPRQSRSQATVEAILEAAARVLAEESLAGFNTNRVAERAGVSVGSLYQYFPNKAALVRALVEAAQAKLTAAAQQLAAARAPNLRAALDSVARLAISQQFEDPLLAAALDHEEQRLPLDDVLGAAQRDLAQAFEALLAPHAAELAPDLGRSAAIDCLTIAKALVETAAQRTTRPPRDLHDRIVRALYGYLTAST